VNRGPLLKLPKPERWHDKPTWLGIAGLAAVVGFGVLSACWAVVVVTKREYLTAQVMCGFAICSLCFVLAATIKQLGRITVRGTYDSGGTVLRVDRGFARLTGIAGAAFVGSGALFVSYVPFGELDIPLGLTGRITFSTVIAPMVVWAVIAFGRARGRGATGHVRLTLDGFDVADVVSTCDGRWADVVDVTDRAPDKRARRPVVLEMKTGPRQVITTADSYTPHGRGLYWMVRHYWKHPQSCSEFTNGQALQRLRDEEFDVD
jgi:hypothetical protein